MVRKRHTTFLLLICFGVVHAGAQSFPPSGAEVAITPGPAPNGQPLTLEQAIATALQNNLSLQAAQRGVNATQWGVKRSYLDYLPRLDFQFRYTRLDQGTLDRANAFYNFVQDNADAFPEELSRNVRPGAYRDSYGPSFSVVQPIYNGGLLNAQRGLANAVDDHSHANLDDTRQQVVFDTYNSYFQVLKARELLALVEESRRSANEHLQSSRRMLEVGMRARNEVLRFEVAVANAENAVILAQNNLQISQSSLNNVLGVELSRDYTLTPVEGFGWQPPRTLEEQMQVAQSQNPGLQLLRSDVAAQHALSHVARSELLPKINLAYSYSWEANDTWAFDSIKSWSLGVVASVPIFHSFQDYAGWQVERERWQQLRKIEEDYVRALQLQVKQASLNLEASEQRMTITAKAVEEAAENLRIVNNSYQVGLLSSLDVVDAEVARIQARANQIDARYDFFIAKAQLARAMGVLKR